ncbi:beta transducin-like protein HET-E2C*4 [Immersiella caudata]|uniref:Beta transducin-like protein HET-E2C*4 n=1 Tax=Immersiella caudata TaxID=314043 RepID=A0AA39WLK0_9PEZI|nr:beta transducin-like protein HET-E2C*4 [Immersiella caudata]
MRLLQRHLGEVRLRKPVDEGETPPYAILSHTWGEMEVLFQHLKDGTTKGDAAYAQSYAKMEFCGNQALTDGLDCFWVDTCCIDKSDAIELQGALNSMFQCYLVDVSTSTPDDKSSWEPAFRASRWFTRGWTLQELVAPADVEFFSKEGHRLGNKQSLEEELHAITGIPLKALRMGSLSDFGVDERISWIKKRQTKYVEDKAYSLFGIFGVHLPILYGEGEASAFDRLRQAIQKGRDRLAKLWSNPLHPSDTRDPRIEKQRIEATKGGLLSDACHWVVGNERFRRWRETPENPILWVKGDPGKGKTMLLCSMINELEQPIASAGGNLAYFFCQATDQRINNATAVLRGLIYLLAHRQPRLLSHFTDDTYPSDDATAWVVLSSLFRRLLQDPSLKATYLVVDALDECTTGLEQLLCLTDEIVSAPSRVKWLLSSRKLPSIELRLTAMGKQSPLSLELNAKSVAAAVDVYIHRKVHHLSRIKQYDDETKRAVQQHLSTNANGTFLWVALVCQSLESIDVLPWNTHKVLERFPAQLGALYGRMMLQIHKLEDAELCKRILAIATLAYRPLTQQELASLADVPLSISSRPAFLENLIQLCGVPDEASRDTFQHIFPLGVGHMHKEVCLRSLRLMSGVLFRDMYHLRDPGFAIDRVHAPQPDPLAQISYSCVYWIDHLSESASDTTALRDSVLGDGGIVHAFLKTKYIYWLEALSLLRAVSKGITAVRRLENMTVLVAFVWDAYRLAAAFGQIIEEAPLQTYASALTFAPKNSLVKKCFQRDIPDWVGTVSAVDAEWDACLQTLIGHSSRDAEIMNVVFSPDGHQLASASEDTTIKIWDAASGKCLQTLRGHKTPVNAVVFSPDGLLASGASGSDIESEPIRIWNTTFGRCIMTLQLDKDGVDCLAFSPDGLLASASLYRGDHAIRIWNITTGQCLRKFHNLPTRSIAFTDGKFACAINALIIIWCTKSWQCLQTLKGHNKRVRSIAFSPHGLLASASPDDLGSIRIWNPESGACVQSFASKVVGSLAFSPNGLLASTSLGQTIRIWNPASAQCLQTLHGHTSPVTSLTFSQDGLLASGSSDGTVKIWDTTSGIRDASVRSQREGEDGRPQYGYHIGSVALSSDGLKFATAGPTTKVWSTTSGKMIQTINGHTVYQTSVAFSSDDRQLASGSRDGTVEAWDTWSWESRMSVVFSPDGKQLASASSRDGVPVIQLWDIASGRNVIWLPPDYRPRHVAIRGRVMTMCCASGRVFFIRFKREI